MSEARPAARSGWRRAVRPRSLVLLAVVAWAALAGLSLVWARSAATDGLASVSEAQRHDSLGQVVEGRPLRPLEAAQEDFARAERLLGSAVLLPLRVLPVVGRQVRSGHALMGAAAEVAGTGAFAVAEGQAAFEQPHGTGAERLALLRRLAGLAAATDRRLARVDLGPRRALVGPLARRRAELADRLARARRGLADARVVTGGVADLLAGPRHYLVLAANNAEMRAGSGMFLSAGELRVREGTPEAGAFRPSYELNRLPPVAPPVDDPDLAGRWGWLNPNREWRNLGSSPRFDASAALARRMWQAAGGPPVDGVLAIDVIGLRAILRATGPVRAAGHTVNGDNVVDLLLHDQYLGISGERQQQARREQLGEIAQAALGAVRNGDADLGVLADELARAARGRHLLAWSSSPAEQRLWTVAGVDGRLQPASLLVGVLNRGANKLDRSMRVRARLELRPDGADTEGRLRVTLRNTTPEGEPSYIAGPAPGLDTAPGEYLGILAVTLPGATTSASIDGADTYAAAGPDGPCRVIAREVRVPRGAERELVVLFRLPGRAGSMVVEPSARVPPVEWSFRGLEWEDRERQVVGW